MLRYMIDLHCHTTASDGSSSPTKFIQDAAKLGVHTVALTDHDTTAGIAEATATAERLNIRVIPGVELSADSKTGNIHILGYHIDVDNPKLTILTDLKNAKAEKALKMVEILQKNGYDITWDDVKAIATGVIGRPHIAQVLVQKGYEPSIKVAIDSGILADNGICDIQRPKLSAEQCVELISSVNGIAVLAHPYQTKFNNTELDAFIKRLIPHGLKGIETLYSEHSEEMTNTYRALAAKYQLIETGGSDWHGTIKPHIQLGTGRGNLTIPQSFVTVLDSKKLEIEQMCPTI